MERRFNRSVRSFIWKGGTDFFGASSFPLFGMNLKVKGAVKKEARKLNGIP